MTTNNKSFETFPFAGLALDPIHVGTGGSRLGRVDNPIVRDPVTRIPKIPGSSLAGVMRAYAAMKCENDKPPREIDGRRKPYYPDCAGLGQSKDGKSDHCRRHDCKVCTVFGFARGRDAEGGFAGLAAFSDLQVLLFPVASQLGPQWITSPLALRPTGLELDDLPEPDFFYRLNKTEETKNNPGEEKAERLNLGWLYLPVKEWDKLNSVSEFLNKRGVPPHILKTTGVVSDKLFAHIVNSNLEVRTSVAIDPATGAAEDKALFTYEALPRGTVLFWELTCRNPKHFRIDGKEIEAVKSPEEVKEKVTGAGSYLEHLGLGGLGSRGLGRLKVLETEEVAGPAEAEKEGP